MKGNVKIAQIIGGMRRYIINEKLLVGFYVRNQESLLRHKSIMRPYSAAYN
jgi:hypothetical protein